MPFAPRFDSPPPRLEGAVDLPDGRRLGFAEYGVHGDRAILWFHGTPGARRQVPPLARSAAERHGVRLIGVERPGIGASTRHLYETVSEWPRDVVVLLDALGIDRFGAVGLSGGGPYTIACAHELPDRMVGAAILGGVAPTVGPDAPATGGAVRLARPFNGLLTALHPALGFLTQGLVVGLAPVAPRVYDLFAGVMPEGDQEVFAHDGVREMFLDDLLRGSRGGFHALWLDTVQFGRDWGFRLEDIAVPVRWWHGDADPLVPLHHAEHVTARLPDCELHVRHGESHLGGFGAAEEVLGTLLALWDGGGVKAASRKKKVAARAGDRIAT